MLNSIPIGISLPTNIVKKIDKERGDIPRSRYVLRILEQIYLKEPTDQRSDTSSNLCSSDGLAFHKSRSSKNFC